MPTDVYAGSAAVLEFIGSAGTATMTTYFRSFSWQPTLNFIDATAGQDTFEVLLGSYGTGQDIEVPFLAPTNGTAIADALAKNVAGTLYYSPEGTATGKLKYLIPATSQGVGWDSPFDDVTVMTARFRQTSEFSGTVW